MGAVLDRIGSVLSVIRVAFAAIASVVLLGLAAMTTADTVFRYVFSSPFPATVEMSQLMQPWVIFLPLAYTLATGSHVRVTLVTQRFRGRARLFVELISFGVGIVFFALILHVSWQFFWRSFSVDETMLAAISLRWWIGKLAMPLGIFLIGVECVYRFIRIIVDGVDAAEETRN